MIKQVNRYTFRDEFQAIRPDNFSYDGLDILFDYLEELEASTDNVIELDVIALCCDYAEAPFETVASDYGVDITNMTRADGLDAVLEYLNENTSTCGVTEHGSIVYCSAF